MSLLDLFGKDANFFTGQTPEQRARGAGQIAYESIPGVSEAVTYRDIKAELGKENPNWWTIGLLGGAGILGIIPLVGDAAGSAIRQGVRARNAVKPSSGVLDEFAKDNFGNKLGINVRSDSKEGLSYSDLILDGKKAYETRDSDSLRKYVGKRVGIVKTGEGDASALGSVIIGEPEIVGVDQFRKLEKEHLVPEGSDFDIKEKKYLYPLINPQRFDAPMQVGKGIVSRKMLTTSQKQSQDILDLLKSGKADQVTDQMLAKADQRYLFENYDLPMDADSLKARAKEMGLGTHSFHGTKSNIQAVDPSYFGKGEDKLGSGFYTTTNPERAERYVPYGNRDGTEYTDGGNILPLSVREAKPFNLEEKLGSDADKIAEAYSKNPSFDVETMSSGAHIVRKKRLDSPTFSDNSVFLDSYLPKWDALNKIRNSFGADEASKVLSDVGYSGVSAPETFGSKVQVSYNPSNVRSRFARFDPRLKHLKNLSAGLVPIGLLPFLMGDSEGAQ